VRGVRLAHGYANEQCVGHVGLVHDALLEPVIAGPGIVLEPARLFCRGTSR